MLNACFVGEKNRRAAMDSSSSFCWRSKIDMLDERAESGGIVERGEAIIDMRF